MFGISKGALGSAVKTLRAQGTFFASTSGRLPFENCLDVTLDYFDHLQLQGEERSQLKEIAKE